MIDYELAAYESVERLKREHITELSYLKNDFDQSPRRYPVSKKVVEFRSFEKTTFQTKNYDGATYYKHLADSLEVQERKKHDEKLATVFNNEEQRLKKMQST